MRLAILPSQTKSDIENHVSPRRSGKDVVLKTRAAIGKKCRRKKRERGRLRERPREGGEMIKNKEPGAK